jgi:hypothetical protein
MKVNDQKGNIGACCTSVSNKEVTDIELNSKMLQGAPGGPVNLLLVIIMGMLATLRTKLALLLYHLCCTLSSHRSWTLRIWYGGTGPLPSTYGNLRQLYHLDMASNVLTGIRCQPGPCIVDCRFVPLIFFQWGFVGILAWGCKQSMVRCRVDSLFMGPHGVRCGAVLYIHHARLEQTVWWVLHPATS